MRQPLQRRLIELGQHDVDQLAPCRCNAATAPSKRALAIGVHADQVSGHPNRLPFTPAPIDAGIVRHGLRRGRRVVGIGAGDDAEHDGGIERAAAHRPDMVERLGQRKDAGAADAAPGRLEAADSPFMVEGKRIEPPVSEPSEAKQRPAAVATPEPEDETPVQ